MLGDAGLSFQSHHSRSWDSQLSHNRRELLDLLPLNEEEIVGTRPLQDWINLIDLCQERAQISFLSESQRNNLLVLQSTQSNQNVLFTFDDFFNVLKHVTKDENDEEDGNSDDEMNMHHEDNQNKDTHNMNFQQQNLEPNANNKKHALLPSANHFIDLDSRPRSSMPLSTAPSKPRKRRPETIEDDPDADDRMSGSDGHPSITSFTSSLGDAFDPPAHSRGFFQSEPRAPSHHPELQLGEALEDEDAFVASISPRPRQTYSALSGGYAEIRPTTSHSHTHSQANPSRMAETQRQLEQNVKEARERIEEPEHKCMMLEHDKAVLSKAVDEHKEQVQYHEDQIEQLQQRASEASKRHATQQKENERIVKDMDARMDDLEKLQLEADEMRAKLQLSENRIALYEQEKKKLLQDIENMRKAQSSLELEFESHQGLQHDLDDLAGENERLKEIIDELKHELDEARARSHQERRPSLQTLDDELGPIQGENKEPLFVGTHYRAMEEALEEKDNTITELKIKLDTLQAELNRLEEKLQKSDAQESNLAKENTKLARVLQQLRDELTKAQNDAAAAAAAAAAASQSREGDCTNCIQMAQYQIDAERLVAQLAEQESIIEALSGGSYMRAILGRSRDTGTRGHSLLAMATIFACSFAFFYIIVKIPGVRNPYPYGLQDTNPNLIGLEVKSRYWQNFFDYVHDLFGPGSAYIRPG